MLEYEIRILKNDRLSQSLVFAAFYYDDAEAIRTANKLAVGYGVEVWRDIECIHRASQHTSGAAKRAA